MSVGRSMIGSLGPWAFIQSEENDGIKMTFGTKLCLGLQQDDETAQGSIAGLASGYDVITVPRVRPSWLCSCRATRGSWQRLGMRGSLWGGCPEFQWGTLLERVIRVSSL